MRSFDPRADFSPARCALAFLSDLEPRELVRARCQIRAQLADIEQVRERALRADNAGAIADLDRYAVQVRRDLAVLDVLIT